MSSTDMVHKVITATGHGFVKFLTVTELHREFIMDEGITVSVVSNLIRDGACEWNGDPETPPQFYVHLELDDSGKREAERQLAIFKAATEHIEAVETSLRNTYNLLGSAYGNLLDAMDAAAGNKPMARGVLVALDHTRKLMLHVTKLGGWEWDGPSEDHGFDHSIREELAKT